MKRLMVKSSLVGLAVALIAMNADAQRSKKVRNPQGNPQNQTQQQSTNNNKQPSGYSPYGNIPIVVDTSGVTDNTVKKSLRNDNAFDKTGLMERTPLAYEHLRWDDALFAEKVWREIDLREKINQVFRYEAQDDNGSQIFVDMLLKGLRAMSQHVSDAQYYRTMSCWSSAS